MLRILISTAFVLTAGIGVAAVAQSVDGIDIDAIKKRSGLFQNEAATTVEQGQGNAQKDANDADNLVKAALSNVGELSTSLNTTPRVNGNIDFDEMVRISGKNLTERKPGPPLFIAFASLSMPKDSIRAMISDVGAAGGITVFRGFTNNSLRQFTTGLTKILGENPGPVAMSVDPRLFRAFSVQRVPAYVVTSRDFELCEGLDCVSSVPAHDMMTGNVTVAYALETFADAKGPGARIATVALSNLNGADR